MLPKTFDKNILNIIKVILLVAFLIYLYFIGNHFIISSTMVSIAEITKDILSGDLFISEWNLSYSSNLFTQVVFYILPVLFCGVSIKAIHISLFLIMVSTIATGALLLKDTIKDIDFKDVTLYICLCGFGLVALQAIQFNGACIPFVFLILLFTNKYLKTENKKYLIYTSLLSIFLVFGDIFSLVICFAPIILYSFFSIFYKEKPQKYIKLIVTMIISVLTGILLYTQYIHYNTSGTMYQWFTTKTFIDDYTNIDSITNLNVFIRRFSEVQNMNFFSEYIVSTPVFLYIFRTIVTLTGLILAIKNILNVCKNNDEKEDIISFSLSSSILFIILFSLFLEANLREYAYYIYAILPIAMSILIMRTTNCFSKLSLFQYSILFLISAVIFVSFCPKDFKNDLKTSKYPIINKILLEKNLTLGYGN